jgi:hypothetical protein
VLRSSPPTQKCSYLTQPHAINIPRTTPHYHAFPDFPSPPTYLNILVASRCKNKNPILSPIPLLRPPGQSPIFYTPSPIFEKALSTPCTYIPPLSDEDLNTTRPYHDSAPALPSRTYSRPAQNTLKLFATIQTSHLLVPSPCFPTRSFDPSLSVSRV